MPGPYQSPDWALVPAKPAYGLNTNDDDIYGISSLRVNDLTLILLTWRKW